MQVLHALPLIQSHYNTPFFDQEICVDTEIANLFHSHIGKLHLSVPIRLANEYLRVLYQLVEANTVKRPYKLDRLKISCRYWTDVLLTWTSEQQQYELTFLNYIAEENKDNIDTFWNVVSTYDSRLKQLVEPQYHYEHILYREFRKDHRRITDRYFSWVKDIPRGLYPNNMMNELAEFSPFQLAVVFTNMFQLTRSEIEQVVSDELGYSDIAEERESAFVKRSCEFREFSDNKKLKN